MPDKVHLLLLIINTKMNYQPTKERLMSALSKTLLSLADLIVNLRLEILQFILNALKYRKVKSILP